MTCKVVLRIKPWIPEGAWLVICINCPLHTPSSIRCSVREGIHLKSYHTHTGTHACRHTHENGLVASRTDSPTPSHPSVYLTLPVAPDLLPVWQEAIIDLIAELTHLSREFFLIFISLKASFSGQSSHTTHQLLQAQPLTNDQPTTNSFSHRHPSTTI